LAQSCVPMRWTSWPVSRRPDWAPRGASRRAVDFAARAPRTENAPMQRQDRESLVGQPCRAADGIVRTRPCCGPHEMVVMVGSIEASRNLWYGLSTLPSTALPQWSAGKAVLKTTHATLHSSAMQLRLAHTRGRGWDTVYIDLPQWCSTPPETRRRPGKARHAICARCAMACTNKRLDFRSQIKLRYFYTLTICVSSLRSTSKY